MALYGIYALCARLGPLFGAYAVTYRILSTTGTGCRLVVKVLMAYPRQSLLRHALRGLGPLADFVMMRKQLLTLKWLAERDAAATPRGARLSDPHPAR